MSKQIIARYHTLAYNGQYELQRYLCLRELMFNRIHNIRCDYYRHALVGLRSGRNCK